MTVDPNLLLNISQCIPGLIFQYFIDSHGPWNILMLSYCIIKSRWTYLRKENLGFIEFILVFYSVKKKKKWNNFQNYLCYLDFSLYQRLNDDSSGVRFHRISQARILEWIAIPFCRGSSWPRNWTQVSFIVSRLFTIWATREAPYLTWFSFMNDKPLFCN